MKNKLNRLILYLFIAVLLHSCVYRNEEDMTLAVDCSKVIPDTVSFSKDVQPILTNNCATANCHSGNSPEGKLNLESGKAYAQLMKKGSGYVDTINPGISVLNSMLISKSNPMPPTGKLDACSIELITEWMKQKAKNN
jgi:hypothetical protein